MNIGLQEAGLLVLAAVVLIFLLWLILKGKTEAESPEDTYVEGLELWLAGDRRAAIDTMRRAVDTNPGSIDPYLQLGHFLRQTGDPRRAAALHRSLAARTGLSRKKNNSIMLALAEDLIALSNWDEAGQLLGELQKQKQTSARFWRARFHQCVGKGDDAAAADALKAAVKQVSADDQASLKSDLAIFQLDRGLKAVRDNRPGDARRLVNDAAKYDADPARSAYVKALSELADDQPAKASETATAGLLSAPDQSELLLPILQKALLLTGRYERSIPILESACQAAEAPPSLWIALAMLHEKLGDRELAVRLLEGKSGDERLTLDASAPFLKILVNDLPDCDFKRIWDGLHTRTGPVDWHCSSCGHRLGEIRWQCPTCRSLDTIESGAPHPGNNA
jgi:lipopolysaccharide assembly protein B